MNHNYYCLHTSVSWLPRPQFIYIYIYIYNNLLNNSTYGKGKNLSNSKIKIYNESLSRGKIYIGKKKKRPTLSHQLKKNQQIHNRLVKRKKHRKLLLSYKCKKCSILSRAKQFRLSGSFGYLIGFRYPDELLRRNCSRLVPDSRNNFYH